jgi:hypothetical protein
MNAGSGKFNKTAQLPAHLVATSLRTTYSRKNEQAIAFRFHLLDDAVHPNSGRRQ